MASMFKHSRTSFAITPHRVSVCILIQTYVSPSHFYLPDLFSSVSHHNSFGLFLLASIKSYDDILEPKLDELLSQLREIGGLLDQRLTQRLVSLSSPDELFNLFSELQGILGASESSVSEDDQISLDPSSNLGMFLRRCLLAFSMLSFEGVCHLLSNIELYCKELLPASPSFDLTCLDGFNDESGRLMEYDNMDLDNFASQDDIEVSETTNRVAKGVSFHLHVPNVLDELVKGVDVSAYAKQSAKGGEGSSFTFPEINDLDTFDANVGTFLRSNLQMHGYLLEQADEIEKHGSSFPLNTLEFILKKLQKLAPELHRVHFLRYLNMLHHDDYTGALESLHRYFDYSAGMEGFEFCSSSSDENSFGKYEVALLCCGLMHVHFGHPKLALEVLTEAVRASQQLSNDSCLAYTLTVICSLLSQFGITSATRILGSSYSMTSIDSSLTIHQQLYVLLRRALTRSESLNLTPLVSANHLEMAKFDMMHVQRPMLSFGPKASISLRTRPADVCKELRLSSHVISEFCDGGSVVSRDGSFATAWLKNSQKPMGPLLVDVDNVSGNDSKSSEFCAHKSSIPMFVQQLLGSSFLLRATSWEMYGSTSLARINALVYATCFVDASSLDNLALACSKLVQHLAAYKGYKEAFMAFRIVEEKFHVISKSRILQLKLQLLHELALHRGHLKLAQQVCDELDSLASPVTGVDIELKTEASLRHARTLLAANQFSQGRGGPGMVSNAADNQQQVGGPAVGVDPTIYQPIGLPIAMNAASVMAGVLGGFQTSQMNQSGLPNQLAGGSDPLTYHLAKMSRSQLHQVMQEIKVLSMQNKDVARQLLLVSPHLPKALFQAQIMLGMVTPQMLQMPNIRQRAPSPSLQPSATIQVQQPATQTSPGLPPLAPLSTVPQIAMTPNHFPAPLPLPLQARNHFPNLGQIGVLPPSSVPAQSGSSSLPPVHPQHFNGPQMQTVRPVQAQPLQHVGHSGQQTAPNASLQSPFQVRPMLSDPMNQAVSSVRPSLVEMNKKDTALHPQPTGESALVGRKHSSPNAPLNDYQNQVAPPPKLVRLNDGRGAPHSSTGLATSTTPRFKPSSAISSNLGAADQTSTVETQSMQKQAAAQLQLPPDLEPALVQQVLSLTPEQLSSLPPDQQQQVIQLQQMLRS